MVSREVYVSGHFRSLLISRFNYTKINSIVRLKSLKIIALVPPSHYEVVALTLFLGTGIWPVGKIYQKKKWGRGGKYQLLSLTCRVSNKYLWLLGHPFLWKLSVFYFPCVDAADRKADYVFVISGVSKATTFYAAPYLVESFSEINFLTDYSSKLVKSLSKYWSVRWSFTTSPTRSIVEHTAPLRAFSFGATS